MARKTLKVGIVGCGGIARAHLAGYREAKGVAVAAVTDVVPVNAAKLAGESGAAALDSIEEMIRFGVDAVSVCTPPGVHLEVCRPLLKAGIPVLCEKPLEANAATAARLASLVEKSGTVFMVAFCHRFHPPIVKMKELIGSGKLGKPLFFRNIFSGYMDLKPDHRSKPELSGGGSMIDNCSHSVDLFRFLVGDPTRVSCMSGNVLQKLPVEDFGAIQLDVGGRSFGQVVACHSFGVGSNQVEWYGTQGTLILNYWNDLTCHIRGCELVRVTCPDTPNRFAAEIAHFLDCVRKKRASYGWSGGRAAGQPHHWGRLPVGRRG